MTWARRVDGPQAAIVKALRKVGCQVADLSRLGDGVPDLLVLKGRQIVLMEVKRPGGKLRPKQVKFREGWPVVVVESVEEALHAVGIR